MEEYRLKAFAKINLGLDVVGRLPDGYHQVRMIMQNIGIYDELTLRKAEASITVTTDSGELPTDEGNLVYRAAKLMFEKYGIGSGIRIHLQKNIPIAAGLAGGSADAAAAMLGICRLFGLDIPLEQLMQDGVSIGADALRGEDHLPQPLPPAVQLHPLHRLTPSEEHMRGAGETCRGNLRAPPQGAELYFTMSV